ncbi:hypothetical protein GCM10027435_09710 [Haloparvum alkalitolerans]|uniref:hypothetical protein n=1 Tax=Haloparvum alkalitolerans TaxID=1042953 RepID=UPI003CEA84A1
MSDDGLLGSLTFVGLVSLCCLGLGGIVGGAAVGGGTASVSAFSTGATGVRGALVTGVVTALALLLVAGAVRLRS